MDKITVTGLVSFQLIEMFGAGTACVVCPIEKIIYEGDKLHIPTMDQNSPLWQRFWNQLTDIQVGNVTPRYHDITVM